MKRIIGKVLIQDNLVVNSYGFGSYRPCGSPHEAMKRLQEWEIDEILVLNRSHSPNLVRDWHRIFRSKTTFALNTPVTYGGGVLDASSVDIQEIMECGVERLVVALRTKDVLKSLKKIASIVGEQALVLHLPFVEESNKYFIKRGNHTIAKLEEIANQLKDWSGEIMLTDVVNEGKTGKIRPELLIAASNFEGMNISVSGGITDWEDLKMIFNHNSGVSGGVIGNLHNRQEIAVSKLRNMQMRQLIRMPDINA